MTVGAPVPAALAGGMPCKPLLLAVMAVLIAGNLPAAVAPGQERLVVARFLTGLAQGRFLAIAPTVATGLLGNA